MLDMQKVLQTKERILEVIRQRGPELPVRVAKAIGGNNLFTAAFMSELVGEQKLKLSNMRVGSSPLYYIIGQEEQLQKYTEYLNHKEREAFRQLKENKILEDDKLEPAIRVALRSIKDFATPIQTINNGETKIFWKIHTLDNNEAKEIIELSLKPKIEKKAEEKIEKVIKEEIIEKTKLPEEKVAEKAFEEKQVEILKVPKEKQTIKEISSPFLENIKKILDNKNFKVLSELIVKKKEYVAKVLADTHLGKQEVYLVAKDKKKITIDDFVNTIQKSQSEKMQALILSPGEIDKKALSYYKEW